MHVHLVCDTEIKGGCSGTITTWVRREYNAIHMVLGFLETVSFNGSLRFDIWVEIQGHGGVGLMVPKVDGEDIERNINREQKCFIWMRNG